MDSRHWLYAVFIITQCCCLASKTASYPFFCGSDAPTGFRAYGGFEHKYVDGASLNGDVVRERIQVGPFYGNITFGLVNDTGGTLVSPRSLRLLLLLVSLALRLGKNHR